MYVGRESVENITTVGQLKDALSKFHPDMPLECDCEKAVLIQRFIDRDTNETAFVSIEGMERED